MIGFWNIRGVKKKNIKEMINFIGRIYSIDVMVLCEIKIKERFSYIIAKNMGF